MVVPIQRPMNALLEDPVSERFLGRVPDQPADPDLPPRADRYGDWRLAAIVLVVALVTLAVALLLRVL